jgi:hypothetical protein
MHFGVCRGFADVDVENEYIAVSASGTSQLQSPGMQRVGETGFVVHHVVSLLEPFARATLPLLPTASPDARLPHCSPFHLHDLEHVKAPEVPANSVYDQRMHLDIRKEKSNVYATWICQ